jgi:hypothetical protein
VLNSIYECFFVLADLLMHWAEALRRCAPFCVNRLGLLHGTVGWSKCCSVLTGLRQLIAGQDPCPGHCPPPSLEQSVSGWVAGTGWLSSASARRRDDRSLFVVSTTRPAALARAVSSAQQYNQQGTSLLCFRTARMT